MELFPVFLITLSACNAGLDTDQVCKAWRGGYVEFMMLTAPTDGAPTTLAQASESSAQVSQCQTCPPDDQLRLWSQSQAAWEGALAACASSSTPPDSCRELAAEAAARAADDLPVPLYACPEAIEPADQDNDGAFFGEDCDDTDQEVGSSALDVDCDGFVTADDCDDQDGAINPDANEVPYNGIDEDCSRGDECDVDGDNVDASTGPCSGDDCNDNDTRVGSKGGDHDCDGARTDADCNDSDPAVLAQSGDHDCDGATTSKDCDDYDDTSTIVARDRDCDGWEYSLDCDEQRSWLHPYDYDGDGYVDYDYCGYRDISVNYGLACALDSDSLAICWGDSQSNDTPPPGQPFVGLEVGKTTSCGLTPDGVALCWGSVSSPSWTPPPSESYFQLSVNHDMYCAVDFAGQIDCWGAEIVRPFPADDYEKVTLGDFPSALTSSGDIISWDGFTTYRRTVGPFDDLVSGYEYVGGIANGEMTLIHGAQTGVVGQAYRTGLMAADFGYYRFLCGIYSNGESKCTDSRIDGELAARGRPLYVDIAAGWHDVCFIEEVGGIDCFTSDFSTTPVVSDIP